MKINRFVICFFCLFGLWLGVGLQAHAQTDTVTYVYTDPQGTPLVKADASGNVIARYDYTPYGNAVTSLGSPPNGPGYTGHVNDPETGLVYMQARYYQPDGRFLSPDPVGPMSGNIYSFNRYAYANDNPYRYTDPDGRYICSGSKDQCSVVSTALTDISRAAANLKHGSADQQRLTAVLTFFGKEGVKNGVKVKFSSIKGEMANTDSKGRATTVTLNLQAMQKVFTGRSDGSTPASEYAGIVAHEGTHGIDGQARGGTNPLNKDQEETTEHNAFEAQAATAQGLGINSAYGLWRSSWPAQDMGVMRENSVQSNADTATANWCSQGNPPGC